MLKEKKVKEKKVGPTQNYLLVPDFRFFTNRRESVNVGNLVLGLRRNQH